MLNTLKTKKISSNLDRPLRLLRRLDRARRLSQLRASPERDRSDNRDQAGEEEVLPTPPAEQMEKMLHPYPLNLNAHDARDNAREELAVFFA